KAVRAAEGGRNTGKKYRDVFGFGKPNTSRFHSPRPGFILPRKLPKRTPFPSFTHQIQSCLVCFPLRSRRATATPADERRGTRQQRQGARLGILDVYRAGRGNPGCTAIEAQLREDVEEAGDLKSAWRRVHDRVPTGRSECRALANQRTGWQPAQIQRKHLRGIGMQG